jgi:hypothetical protein
MIHAYFAKTAARKARGSKSVDLSIPGSFPGEH